MLKGFTKRVVRWLHRYFWSGRYPQVVTEFDHERVLVLAPHPDDDVIGMGGLLAILNRRAAVKIVYLTDGQLGIPGKSCGEAAEIRRNEARLAAARLGCHDLDFLGMMDGEVRPGKEPIKRIGELLRDFRPQAVFAPFWLDLHPDHANAAQILAQALERHPEPLECWSYEVWSTLVPNRVVDITSTIEDKKAAIGLHCSQVAVIDYLSKIGGLNAYRSMTVPSATFAEAFLVLDKTEYAKMAKRLKSFA